MKRIIILSLALLLCANVGFAQKKKETPKKEMPDKEMIGTSTVNKTKSATIKWSDETKELAAIASPICYDKSGIYGIYGMVGRESSRKIMRFSQDFQLQKEGKLDMKDAANKKTCEFEFTQVLNNKLYLFTSFYNLKKARNYLFYQEINKKEVTVQPERNKIAEINLDGKARYEPGSFRPTISSDSSKLLVYYIAPDAKKENQTMGFHVFDKNMKQIWEKEVELPFKSTLFECVDYELDNAGNVYVVGKLYKDKVREKYNKTSNYKYIVISWRKNGAVATQYPVELDGNYITELRMVMNNKTGNIVCGGYYSTKEGTSIKGSFYLNIDPNTEAVNAKTMSPFTFEQMTQNITEKQKKSVKKQRDKGKEQELSNIDLNRIILRDDGGVVLLGEYKNIYVTSYTTTDSRGVTRTTYTTHYVYGDAIVTNVSPQGKIEWSTTVPKYSHTTDDGGGFGSFTSAVVGSKIYLIYTDNLKNLTAEPGKKSNIALSFWNGSKNLITTIATVDNTGKLKRELLFTKAEADCYVTPRISRQVSKNEIFLVGFKGFFRAKSRVGRVIFK